MFNDLGPKEAVYYLTMMAVAGVAYVSLARVGIESNLVRIIIALVLGVGAGWAAERAYLSGKKE